MHSLIIIFSYSIIKITVEFYLSYINKTYLNSKHIQEILNSFEYYLGQFLVCTGFDFIEFVASKSPLIAM